METRAEAMVGRVSQMGGHDEVKRGARGGTGIELVTIDRSRLEACGGCLL
jgi:hypothetical protein